MQEPTNDPINYPDGDLSSLVITLLKGVIYREQNERLWISLMSLQSRVRDFVGLLGLELVLDVSEGYAFLKSRAVEDRDDESTKTPRLISRRPLSFPVSLLLALLRKKLAEFDSMGSDNRLVLSREQIVDLMRLFFADSSNEAKLVDQIDTHISKVVDLGFLRKLKSSSTQHTYEVLRILKAFVDAQWLSDLDSHLDAYKRQLEGNNQTTTGGNDDAEQ